MKAKWLLLVCLLVALLVGVGCAPAKAPQGELPKAPAGYESIRMVGTSLTSTGATACIALSSVLNKYYPEIEWSSCSGVTATNLIFVNNGTLRLALGMVSGYIDAYGFDKTAESRVRSVSLPFPVMQYLFLVPEDKPWTDITQVPKGLALAVGPGGTVVAFESWMKLCGLSKSDFNVSVLGKSEMSDAWRNGKTDIVFVSIGGMVPMLMDMQTSARKIKAMGLSPEQAVRAKSERAFERIGFEPPSMSNIVELCPEVFKHDVMCTQSPVFLLARDDFPAEIAYKMAKVIDERNAEMTQMFPPMKCVTPQFHIRWARPPLDTHPGVARYYKEKGYLK